MSDELKACPFCGGNNLSAYLSNQGSSIVYCINCYEDNNGLSRDIVGWNTRPLEDELQARITELEDVLEEIKDLAMETFGSRMVMIADLVDKVLEVKDE